jgi:hypothetical protein
MRSSFHALKPDFTPVWIDASWTEKTIVAVFPTANDAIQNDAVAGKGGHFSGALIDNAFHACKNASRTSTVRHHLCIESQPKIAVSVAECLQDFTIGFHLNQLPRLKIEP